MSELRFSSEKEALQYLADKTGKRIKIAYHDSEEDWAVKEDRTEYESKKENDKIVGEIQRAVDSQDVETLKKLSEEDFYMYPQQAKDLIDKAKDTNNSKLIKIIENMRLQ